MQFLPIRSAFGWNKMLRIAIRPCIMVSGIKTWEAKKASHDCFLHTPEHHSHLSRVIGIINCTTYISRMSVCKLYETRATTGNRSKIRNCKNVLENWTVLNSTSAKCFTSGVLQDIKKRRCRLVTMHEFQISSAPIFLNIDMHRHNADCDVWYIHIWYDDRLIITTIEERFTVNKRSIKMHINIIY